MESPALKLQRNAQVVVGLLEPRKDFSQTNGVREAKDDDASKSWRVNSGQAEKKGILNSKTREDP